MDRGGRISMTVPPPTETREREEEKDLECFRRKKALILTEKGFDTWTVGERRGRRMK